MSTPINACLLCIALFVTLSCVSNYEQTEIDRYTIPFPSRRGMVYDYASVVDVIGSPNKLVLFDHRQSIVWRYRHGDSIPERELDLRSNGIIEITGIDVDHESGRYNVADFQHGVICVLDTGFNVVTRYTVPRLQDASGISYSLLSPFFIAKGHLYTVVGANTEVDTFVTKPCVVRHRLGSTSWDSIAGLPPKVRNDPNYYNYYPKMIPIDRNSSTYALAFATEDTIRVYRATSLERIIAIGWQTHYKRQGIDHDAMSVGDFFITAPSIRALGYDRENNHLVVVREDQQPLRNSSGRFNTYRTRPVTIGRYVVSTQSWLSYTHVSDSLAVSHPGPLVFRGSVYMDTFPAMDDFTAFNLRRIKENSNARN